MSLLTTSEVATFLGISDSTPGLQEAVDQAESLIAAKLGLETLELNSYVDEERTFYYRSQQMVLSHGPIREVTSFEYDGDDKLDDVVIGPSGWSLRWDEPFLRDFDRAHGFERFKKAVVSYSAGWTDDSGEYPLPAQVKEYVKAMSGLLLNNLLASGVYDTKLGDMTVKIQRETLEKNLEVYENALRSHARPST